MLRQSFELHVKKGQLLLHQGDALDVVFQADPFALPALAHDGLVFHEELRGPRHTLGSHRVNRQWISGLYGEQVAAVLRLDQLDVG